MRARPSVWRHSFVEKPPTSACGTRALIFCSPVAVFGGHEPPAVLRHRRQHSCIAFLRDEDDDVHDRLDVERHIARSYSR